MPDDTDRINDGIRQQAHAARIADARAQRNASPEQKEQSRLESMIASKVDQAVQKALQNFTIQSGNGISISGSGRNITISTTGAAAGTTQASGRAVCNADGTISITLTF